MSSQKPNILNLYAEIEKFADKFYLNRMLKGALIFLGVLSVSYLFFSSCAYFFELQSWIRLCFLVGFIGLNLTVCIRLLLIPCGQYFRIIRRMTQVESASLIGNMFPDISDRLLNTIQLINQSNIANENLDLLTASIAQKTAQLQLFNFSAGIDLSLNKKYAKYALPSLLTLLLLLIFIPAILTQGTYRIIQFNQVFLPFKFELDAGKSTYEEGSDVPIQVTLNGERIPDKVYLVSDQGKFLMQRALKNRYDFTLKKVKSSGSFYFEANGYQSKAYHYKVTGKSLLGNVSLKIHYPSYLNKKDEFIQNVGDITVPEGSQLTWTGNTKNTKWIEIQLAKDVQRCNNSSFSYGIKAINTQKLRIRLANLFSNKLDSSVFNVNVIKDAHPSIQVGEASDSIQEGLRFFSGQVSDDYGLSALTFNYTILRNGKAIKTRKLPVSFEPETRSNFSFAVDFRLEEVKLEDKIEYFFMVSDNDGVNGSKSTKSYVGEYQLPDLKELNEQRDEQQTQTKQDLERVLNKTKEFEKSVDKLKKDLTNSKSNDWSNKQQLKQLQEEQKSLANELQQIKDQLEQTTQ